MKKSYLFKAWKTYCAYNAGLVPNVSQVVYNLTPEDAEQEYACWHGSGMFAVVHYVET